jgi:hypothetical protein
MILHEIKRSGIPLLNLQTRSERLDASSNNSQFVLITRGVARYDNLGNECSKGWWMKLCEMVKRLDLGKEHDYG